MYKNLFSGLSTMILFISLSAWSANKCYSSIINCGGSPGTDLIAPLKTSTALASGEGCRSAVLNLRNTCKIDSPVSAMYFSNGNLKNSFLLVNPRIKHSNANCSAGGVTVNNGTSKKFYSVATVNGDRDSCGKQAANRFCQDGILSGPKNFDKTSCRDNGGK